DQLIRRNPCRIKGAGQDKADERPTLTIEQVFAVGDAIQPRYRLLVLLGALTSPRFGEFAALRRRDVVVDGGELGGRRSQAELKHVERLSRTRRARPASAWSRSRMWCSKTSGIISTGSRRPGRTVWCSSGRMVAGCGVVISTGYGPRR